MQPVGSSGVLTCPPSSGIFASQSSDYVTVNAGTNGAIVVKGSPGRLFDVHVGTQGTSAVPITDGPGGPMIAMITANAAPGPYRFNAIAKTSINIPAGTNYPSMTIQYA